MHQLLTNSTKKNTLNWIIFQLGYWEISLAYSLDFLPKIQTINRKMAFFLKIFKMSQSYSDILGKNEVPNSWVRKPSYEKWTHTSSY